MNSRNALEDAKDAAGRVGHDLRGELADLAGEVEKLAAEIRRRGRASGRSARAGATEGLAALNRSREELADGVADATDRAVSVVRERPLPSIGIALIVGFLLALLWRR